MTLSKEELREKRLAALGSQSSASSPSSTEAPSPSTSTRDTSPLSSPQPKKIQKLDDNSSPPAQSPTTQDQKKSSGNTSTSTTVADNAAIAMQLYNSENNPETNDLDDMQFSGETYDEDLEKALQMSMGNDAPVPSHPTQFTSENSSSSATNASGSNNYSIQDFVPESYFDGMPPLLENGTNGMPMDGTAGQNEDDELQQALKLSLESSRQHEQLQNQQMQQHVFASEHQVSERSER